MALVDKELLRRAKAMCAAAENVDGAMESVLAKVSSTVRGLLVPRSTTLSH